MFSSKFIFLFLVALPVLVVFDKFILQVLPDIVRSDSSCKSVLVFCQVTSPLLVEEGGRWVLKDLFRPIRCPSNTCRLR